MTYDLRDVQLTCVTSVEEAADLMRWLGERRPRDVIACDTETEGLDTVKDAVRLVQFGDGMRGWTIPWDDWAGVAREVFKKWAGDWVFHNGTGFDLAMLQKYGITLPEHKVHDTMVQAHVLDSTQFLDLKGLSTRKIDSNAAVAQRMLDHAMTENGWTWATIPIDPDRVPVYSVYAAMDTVLTWRLDELQRGEVEVTAPKSYDLEMAFAHAVRRMRARGIRVDVDMTESCLTEFESFVEQVDKWCRKHWGFGAGSNKKILDRFAQDGLVIQKYTCGCVGEDAPIDRCEKRGNHLKTLACDKYVLAEAHRLGHPLAWPVLQRRRAQKLASTFFRNFLKLHRDGVIRADMRSLGARTGRMSVRDPAFQTLPRRAESNPLAVTVRNCVVPGEDNVLLMCDFSQIEMRMLASLSGDDGLIGAFKGEDFFTEACREMFHDPSIVKKDPRRQTTKNAFYAKGYGAGIPKFALTAGIDVGEARQFMQTLDARYPGIVNLQKLVDRVAKQRRTSEGRAYVVSPLTGRRHYVADDREYALVNYLIQGTAAEVLKLKVLELEAAGIADYATMLVHDEVIMDVPRAEALEVRRVLDQVMNDENLFAVKIEADTEAGLRWGQKGEKTLEELVA